MVAFRVLGSPVPAHCPFSRQGRCFLWASCVCWDGSVISVQLSLRGCSGVTGLLSPALSQGAAEIELQGEEREPWQGEAKASW